LVFSCPAAGRELATEPQEAGHEKLLEGILYLHFGRYSLDWDKMFWDLRNQKCCGTRCLGMYFVKLRDTMGDITCYGVTLHVWIVLIVTKGRLLLAAIYVPGSATSRVNFYFKFAKGREVSRGLRILNSVLTSPLEFEEFITPE
jgi:hypothetical protein